MDDSEEGILDHDFHEAGVATGFENKLKLFTSPVTKITLTLSLVMNIFLIFSNYLNPSLGTVSKSRYAGLLNNLDVPFVWDNDRSNPNDTERNKVWYEDVESDEGIMSMDNDEAVSLGLQQSQAWPWDKKKSIYITNGHHNMHCLRNIYISINEYSIGVPQSLELSHILHCMGALYDDIKCNADDTPRFTNKGIRPGEGQIRKCRDWSQLRKWVKERDGCFKYIKHDVKDISTIERMKYCSNDSKYLPLIREFFGLKESWFPWPYVEQEGYLVKGEEFDGRN